MTIFYFVRHGQTDWNVEGRWQGHADVPLNQVGLAQAEQIARQLKDEGLQAIYTSDLTRARQTAEALGRATGLAVQVEPRLREIHQGEWQGLQVGEIEARYGDTFRRRRDDPYSAAPPGGETVEQVRRRVTAALLDIAVQHPQERVAIVSHGFALALAQVHFEGLAIQLAWEMIPRNDEWRVLEIAPSAGRLNR